MSTLLAISQDDQTLNNLDETLREEYQIHRLADFSLIVEAMTQHRPDVVILDTDLHRSEVSTLCRQIQEHTHAVTPILLMASQVNAQDIALLLDEGGDDVIRKPYAARELIARIRALLRWKQNATEQNLVQLRLDSRQKAVYINQKLVRLTPVEFQLLKFLCLNRTKYYTAPDLLTSLWNYPPESGDTALVRNHIRNLRCKLEHDPDHPSVLISHYGRGYTIRAVVQVS